MWLEKVTDSILIWKKVGMEAHLCTDMSTTHSFKLLKHTYKQRCVHLHKQQDSFRMCMFNQVGHTEFIQKHETNAKVSVSCFLPANNCSVEHEITCINERYSTHIRNCLYIKLKDDMLAELNNINNTFIPLIERGNTSVLKWFYIRVSQHVNLYSTIAYIPSLLPSSGSTESQALDNSLCEFGEHKKTSCVSSKHSLSYTSSSRSETRVATQLIGDIKYTQSNNQSPQSNSNDNQYEIDEDKSS